MSNQSHQMNSQEILQALIKGHLITNAKMQVFSRHWDNLSMLCSIVSGHAVHWETLANVFEELDNNPEAYQTI